MTAEKASRESGAGKDCPPAGDAKKAYGKPAIIYRAPLEAMAAVCYSPGYAKSVYGLCVLLYS